jgi:hypothetical protein
MARTIDISSVPVDKRQRPDFVNLYSQIQAAINNPAWVIAFCVHEAGHKIYISRFGVTGFQFLGPRITYDPRQDTFDGFPAAVTTTTPPKPLTAVGFNFDQWLAGIAQTKAAGGVFARVLTPAPDGGDEDDKEEFLDACISLHTAMPNLYFDEESVWQEAQEAITKELRSPVFRKECWDEANKIRQEIFGY